MSGACALTGYEHEPPMRAAVPWVDYSTGLLAAFGTVLALRHRDATGEGQEVDCALLQTAVSYTSPMIAEALVTGRERPRIGNRMPYVGPTDLYRCRDGWVYIATVTDGMWKSLMNLIGRPELAAVPAHATDEGRFEARAVIDPHVEEWMAGREVRGCGCGDGGGPDSLRRLPEHCGSARGPRTSGPARCWSGWTWRSREWSGCR